MKDPAVVIGLGEMGGVFASALLHAGHPVYPVLRGTPPGPAAERCPAPLLALIAVPEDALGGVLERLPRPWRARVGLLQNELLPGTWQRLRLAPTVIAVWFEKKPGQEVRVILPSPAFGPAAGALVAALDTIGIPARELRDEDALLFELVRKNLYILTSNIAGLKVGGSVGDLWSQHRDLARQVAEEVLEIQQWLCGRELPREDLVAGMVEAFEADPEHRCTGRSAPARLARALRHAEQAGIAVPTLRRLRPGG